MERSSTAQLSWFDQVADGPRPRVLLVEADEVQARAHTVALIACGFQVDLVPGSANVLDHLPQVQASTWDAVVIDLAPSFDGLELKRRLRAAGSVAPTLIISDDTSAGTAVRCMQAGAVHYQPKPVSVERLVDLVRWSAGLATIRRNALGLVPTVIEQPLVGHSPAIAQLRTAIHRIGRQDVPVLLHGESGTGKELVARALHDASARARAPFVAFNVAAVPEALVDSELFGYRRGAFTGAVGEHPGVIASAHGGTLLLDEIGDMPLAMQARLLRFLQEGEVRALGARTAQTVDVRVIAATHVDLPAAVAAGRFREDLFYRLNVAPLVVPRSATGSATSRRWPRTSSRSTAAGARGR
ncbi:MAG: sigma-54 dependent transcriptional regulator [Kofleriaceae bacterium]